MWSKKHVFCVKVKSIVLFLHQSTFYKENFSVSRIWRASGRKSFSKVFIHWLFWYKLWFLRWASCPMLPYVSISYISMGKVKKDVTPLLTHWNYVFLATTYWYMIHACVTVYHQDARCHYSDVTMGAMTSQITDLTIVYSTVYLSSASLAFVWGIHRWSVNSLHKGPVTPKMFPFDDVIMHQDENT